MLALDPGKLAQCLRHSGLCVSKVVLHILTLTTQIIEI